ncbi:MAG: N-methyl-D-aspartate receptor NMDAR2C subunit [Rhodoferax sp.]|uniref:HD domain-containing protein n=1 Tax=Rhodoferax sp. TaxID=50421 RepID=UPI002ACD9D9F|nr:N-methyl-D-aspartate receptor NMDAR2C subunit [Rhodoferax sp.]MDZ7891197.1 N-methyl-D-aspartate receptor NMDAR2C subunit [Rhodoferax sp.]
MNTAPSWTALKPLFASAWQEAGAHTDGVALCDALLAAYAEPHRHYHSTQHLAECLHGFEVVRHLAQRPAEVALALWFHDAVYDVQRHDNEAQSADWARQALTTAGVQAEVAERVYELVMATRHTSVPAAGDAQLLVDIDLSILGADAQRFAQYERQIRKEYAFVPEDLFRTKRKEVLLSFAKRSRIYGTDYFHAALEARARANLARAVTSP